MAEMIADGFTNRLLFMKFFFCVKRLEMASLTSSTSLSLDNLTARPNCPTNDRALVVVLLLLLLPAHSTIHR